MRSVFTLDALGWLRWIAPKSKGLKPGDRAGSIDERGYVKVRLNNKTYKAHRLIFLFVNGYLPKFVGHKDKDRANNKPDNLRGSNAKTNACNKTKASNKTSCFKGVSVTPAGRFRAQVTKDRKIYYLGTFDSEIKAARTYNRHARKLHGRFASLNSFKNLSV